MKDRIRMLFPPLPRDRARVKLGEGDRVVLLHGLWRSVWAMEGMAKTLHQAGYETVSVPYASFRKTMNEIVDDVAAELRGLEDGKKVHFVTHSMGGIVARHLADRYPELVTGRLVLLAPPNQGSEIIDWLDSFPLKPLAHFAFGPGGMGLGTEIVRNGVPGFSEDHEVAVVMGRQRTVPFFSSMLEGEHDGIVSAEGGKVEGMSEFRVVDGDHTFLMAEDEVRLQVLNYLQEGRLD
ncbi:alpha/beta fold hydrolase [Akkermansiaceae bacterium]|nr:alpha/beta fold hydrolase [Akkermansiaceae bacterium]